MASAASLARDLKALGSSAPLRAVYEGSKRSGLHSLLFRQSRRPGRHRSVPIGLGGCVPSDARVRERCIEDAAAVLRDGTRVFGTRVPTGVHVPWNVDPLSGQPWPMSEHWWRIDIRSDDRMSDVKWVWEVGRHRDLVVLARAARLEPQGVWLIELDRMLSGWVDQCPPELGVHWYSSLELALRAIAWAQVIELVGEELAPELRRAMDAQLVASARHILMELPYTVSSMKNNHMLGDGLGLVVLGRMFPDHPASQRWQRAGDALLHKQLRRHMRPDGSMIEDSLSYHRFVLEMLVVRRLLGDARPEVRDALRGAAEHLERLGALDGPVPQFGDWDEGRVLADSSPAGSVAGSAFVALSLSGRAVPKEMWEEHDELAWYLNPPSRAEEFRNDHADGGLVAGDFHVLRHGQWRAWVKTGSGPSHQHADVGSVWPAHRGAWLVRDPGTGTYNGPLTVRNGFRSSSAHPVWCPADADQLIPHRAFRWLRTVHAAADEHLTPERSLVLSVHSAFVEEFGSRVARVIDMDANGFVVVDFIEHRGEHSWLMTVPLGDSRQSLVGVPTDCLSGVEEPFRGWHSDTYGAWSPSRWAVVELDGNSHVWGVTDHKIAVEATSVLVGPHRFSITWGARRVTVRVSDAEGEVKLEVLDV